MTEANKPGPSWEKEGLHFKACRINGEAYVELFEGKNCLALIKTYASERKDWWPGIYEDACKEAERLNEQLRSRAQEKAAAPGEESWLSIMREEAPGIGTGFWCDGFKEALSLIARPLLARIQNDSILRETKEEAMRLKAEAASLKATEATLRSALERERRDHQETVDKSVARSKEIDALKATEAALREEHEKYMVDASQRAVEMSVEIVDLREESDTLRAQLAEATKALEFYGVMRTNNYESEGDGSTARAALAKLKAGRKEG